MRSSSDGFSRQPVKAVARRADRIIKVSDIRALIIDVCCTGYIITDLYGVATVIASIASLFGAVGWTKVAGEKRFYDYKKYYPEEKQSLNNKSSNDSICVKPSEDDIENALK